MKRILLALAGALALLAPHAPARAQVVSAQTVSACGTPNNTPVVGNSYPMTMDTTGTLCTVAGGGGGGGGAVYGPNAVGVAAAHPPVIVGGTADATATGTVQVNKVDSGGDLFVNTAKVNGVTTLAGAGASGTGSQRVTVAQDTTTLAGSAPGTAGSASANVVTVQGIASMTKLLVTPDSVALPANQSVNESQINGVTPLMGNGVTGTGSQRVTIASDNTAFSVNPQATATTGVSTKSLQVANNTTSVAVDASAGTLLAVRVFNNSGTIAYAKFYNAAQGSTTCGSGTPVNRVLIPASTSGAGAVFTLGGGYGVAYGTAITVCVTTGFADNDTTAPAASVYIVEADYK